MTITKEQSQRLRAQYAALKKYLRIEKLARQQFMQSNECKELIKLYCKRWDDGKEYLLTDARMNISFNQVLYELKDIEDGE